MVCGQKFRCPSQLGCRVLNKGAKRVSEFDFKFHKVRASLPCFLLCLNPYLEMEYVLQDDDFSLDELCSR